MMAGWVYPLVPANSEKLNEGKQERPKRQGSSEKKTSFQASNKASPGDTLPVLNDVYVMLNNSIST